ncbi:lytic transglycosylase domain-containing protein [bacterium]|nr:lytic transglycosylase domain-containing protein [bacterium]
MFNWELSRMIAKTGSLGIAEAMMRQIGIDNSVEPQPPIIIPGLTRKPNIVNLEDDEIRNTITSYAEQYNVDPDLIRAIIICESNCDANSLSVKGAKGLMQLMDETAREVGVTDPFDPEQNIAGGTAYFRQMLDRYRGDTEIALAAYNAGPSRVDFYEGIPPFKETQDYVRRVISQYDRIQNRIAVLD